MLFRSKEVDPKRIGLTGASGGGYNTWMTAALDDRIAAAVPVVGTSEFYEQIAVCRSLDWYKAGEHCHFVAGLIRFANNHELLAAIAPRPLLIVSAQKDQSFPVTGVREVSRYGQELYGAMKAPERVGYFEDAVTGHGYQQKKREAAYGWFLKWLMGKGDGGPYAEPPTETPAFDAPELRCFPAGENRMAGPGIVAAVERIKIAANARPWPRLEPPSCKPEIGGARVQRVDFCGTPGFVIAPSAPERGVLVSVDDRGKEELAADPAIKDALALGWTVCGIDPRGIGERATAQGWVGAVSLLLDDSYVRRQALDIAAVLNAFPGRTRALYARGQNASLAAAFAIAAFPPDRYILRDGFLSFRQWLSRPDSEPELPLYFFPFRALEREDIPAMLARSRGLLVNPVTAGKPAVRARIVASETPEAEIREFLRR